MPDHDLPDAPSPQDAEAQLEAGLRFQKSGLLDQALACYQDAAAADSPGVVSTALVRIAFIHHLRSEWVAALATAKRAADVAQEAQLHDRVAEALNQIGAVHLGRGEFAEAVAVFERILEITQDHRLRGIALQNLGITGAQRGDFETARRNFLASQRCFQQAGYLWGEAHVMNNFGRAAVEFGNFRVAASMLENAVGAARRVGDLDLLAIATLNHAEALAGLRDYDRAEQLARSAIAFFTTAGNSWRQIEGLRLLGDMAARRAQPDVAEGHYRDGLALAEGIGAAAEAEVLRQRLAALRDAGTDGDKGSASGST